MNNNLVQTSLTIRLRDWSRTSRYTVGPPQNEGTSSPDTLCCKGSCKLHTTYHGSNPVLPLMCQNSCTKIGILYPQMQISASFGKATKESPKPWQAWPTVTIGLAQLCTWVELHFFETLFSLTRSRSSEQLRNIASQRVGGPNIYQILWAPRKSRRQDNCI